MLPISIAHNPIVYCHRPHNLMMINALDLNYENGFRRKISDLCNCTGVFYGARVWHWSERFNHVMSTMAMIDELFIVITLARRVKEYMCASKRYALQSDLVTDSFVMWFSSPFLSHVSFFVLFPAHDTDARFMTQMGINLIDYGAAHNFMDISCSNVMYGNMEKKVWKQCHYLSTMNTHKKSNNFENWCDSRLLLIHTEAEFSFYDTTGISMAAQ